MRNSWRAAHEQPPLATPPLLAITAGDPDTVTALEWSGGPEPTAPNKAPLAKGDVLTSEKLVELVQWLRAHLPANVHGFIVCAERAGDHRGFQIQVEWIAGAPPGKIMWRHHNFNVALDGASLGNSSGSSAVEYEGDLKDKAKAFRKVLGASAERAISIDLREELSAH